ncbi:MAG: hypothetical protein A3G34_15450 [Candidatus Lindowbacteria bacterium RIFCSPLOWO2_12_FULL_62_27]|nr:MAG: hypothetical protein A3I06_01945 [Candidatus Lindowbacteria bacterium RIFCSPLOWO2_02_FULL_62_12]OGH63246.1 MAG: hypothetical protein A3G34_15450 [Candidatus Lindowbacteria bacterium RIFCSPLOWO2_12_FULL_62_27]
MPYEVAASVARADFMKLVKEIKRGRRIFIRHRDEPAAVLMSFKEYQSYKAMERLFRNPGDMKRIQEARAEIAAGKGRKYDDLRKEFGLA